jgi:uncharacterized protein (DUF1800 family)
MPSQQEKVAHLMRRAAFGARPDEIESLVQQGLEATVDSLVNYEQTAEDPAVPLQPATPGAPGGVFDIRYLNIGDVTNWWLLVMGLTRAPLRERMVLFWHDHFATSFEKVNNPNGAKHLYWQNQTERQYATGNFRALCKAINRDPAMIRWLDSDLSIRTSPNENYARELFEIFMLGFDAFDAGIYTEPDVQQAARAFTGWGQKTVAVPGNRRRLADLPEVVNGNALPNGSLTDPSQAVEIPPDGQSDGSYAAGRHDYTDKTVFGVSRNFNGDDIVDLVLDREPQRTAAARMLGRKLFEYFAYEDPEPHVVEHLAAVLVRTNFNIKAVLRDLFLNTKEFYSERAIHALPKWPVHYVVSTLRLLSVPPNTANLMRNTTNFLRSMGQWLFWPPDVFGWPGREEWATTSQYFARANWANIVTRDMPGANVAAVIARGQLGAAPTAEQVVDYLTRLIVQRTLDAEVRQALVDYLKRNDAGVIGNFSLTSDQAANYRKVRGLLHLLLARPECQNH